MIRTPTSGREVVPASPCEVVRGQQDLHAHRGHAADPLYRARRTLLTGDDLLTDKQRARLRALFAGDEHVQVEATWWIYQRMGGRLPTTRPRPRSRPAAGRHHRPYRRRPEGP